MPAPLKPLDEALAELLAHAKPLEPLVGERVSTFDADGRVLLRGAVSPLQVPPQDNSAMDGYAVRVADCGGGSAVLPVSQRIPAGTAAQPLAEGTAVRVQGKSLRVDPGADADRAGVEPVRVVDRGY